MNPTLLTKQKPSDAKEDSLEYPIPYSAERAEQWAAEDPLFCKETYRQDSYFTKENQAKLRSADAQMAAGQTVTQVVDA
jgi:hypothetical protein